MGIIPSYHHNIISSYHHNRHNHHNHHNANTIIHGSWFTTPKKYRIQALTAMYCNNGIDNDEQTFNKSIQEMDSDRNKVYSSKIDVTNDMDNIYGDQHQICFDNGFSS